MRCMIKRYDFIIELRDDSSKNVLVNTAKRINSELES